MNENIKYETSLQTRTENLVIRVTPEEKRQLFISAQKAGIGISAFIRMLFHNYTVALKEK